MTKKNMPLVSVIMSEYNTEPNLLIESIKSILNQSYTNFELIIIDDCGKNNVKKIINQFNDSRIKVFRNENNKGLVFSLNKALNLSKGKYIARMDTDDYSYKNRLQKQIEFIEKNPQYDVVGANVDFYDGNKIWGKSNSFGEIKRKNILNGTPITHPTILAKKEIIESAGGYPDYNRCEDYALWIKLYTKGCKMYKMKEVLLKYHLSLNDYKKRNIKTRKGFLKLLKTEYKNLNPSKIQIIKMYIKTIIAGIIPYKLIYNYHKKKYRKKG